jgi:hypothetical protein
MRKVNYPIVFYSYYNKVGNPGSPSGSSRTTLEKVRAWNASPPNSLDSKTLPSWKNITISSLTSLGSVGYSILWGLALEGYFIDNVLLNNVRISGGPGFEIFNATNVQLTGNSNIGNLIIANSLAITAQPQNQSATPGTRVAFSVTVAGTGEIQADSAAYQWSRNGVPLTDGIQAGGSTLSGAARPTLIIDKVQEADAGKYACTVTARLDAFDVGSNMLVPGKALITATSNAATLIIQSQQ